MRDGETQKGLLALWVMVFACAAQNITGNIVGTVTDSSGAVVANSAVTIISEQTGIEIRTATSATGEYTPPNLPPGIYTLRAELSGFKPAVVRGVRLRP